MNEILQINTLANQGDGVAQTPRGRVFVPFTLGGESVEVSGSSVRRELVRVVEPSQDRVVPICEYFGTCGGCQLQHMARIAYLAWKQDLVVQALAALNIEPAFTAITSFENAKRRRVAFSARHSSDGIIVGFLEKSTQRIVDVKNCPVASPAISDNIQTIKLIIRPLLPAKGNTRIHVLECDNGLDVQIESDGKVNEKSRQAAVRDALASDVLRLSFGNETLVEIRRPKLNMGLASVSPPPGAFVQAMREVEVQMAALVCGHLKSCRNVADLFCGIGTFALRLAEHSTVFASENDQSTLDALDEAWRGTGGRLKSINGEKRDLFVRPVMAEELKKIQGVVFDPPRAGAEAQAKQLALSKVRKIAAISCNPTSLARDLGILTGGGFKVQSVTPIDQFAFTPHVEVVVLLAR